MICIRIYAHWEQVCRTNLNVCTTLFKSAHAVESPNALVHFGTMQTLWCRMSDFSFHATVSKRVGGSGVFNSKRPRGTCKGYVCVCNSPGVKVCLVGGSRFRPRFRPIGLRPRDEQYKQSFVIVIPVGHPN